MYSFLSGRSGARLAAPGQEGFDSALWTSARKQGTQEETPVLFFFENKLSKQDGNYLENSVITHKVTLIKKVIYDYNAWRVISSPKSPELHEEDVVVVFPVFRDVRPNLEIDFEWGGTLLALDRDFLINNFYKCMSPFFRALPLLDGDYAALNVNQLKQLCTVKGITFSPNDKKNVLVNCLYGSKSKAQLEEICRSKGLSDEGDKAALILRLNISIPSTRRRGVPPCPRGSFFRRLI